MEQFQMDLAGRMLTIETGELAKQASGAVMVGYGDTRVLVTATGSKEAKDIDFFPLTVDYEEKMYAVGRLPGGFIKREARPPESASLNSRLIDRPIRPLFTSLNTWMLPCILQGASILFFSESFYHCNS